jgi:aminoglycoside N3'-acetyltransferase
MPRREHSATSLSADLAALGVVEGDTLYVRAALSSIGAVEAPSRQTILQSLLNALGPEGTLVVPAFTSAGWRWSKDLPRFHSESKPNCGALAGIVLSHPDAVRSSHPTHSFAAIGSRALEVLEGHDETRSAFFPMSKLVSSNAKMALIGCGRESPGFSTVHLVQQELGLSQRHFTKYLLSVAIEHDGRWQPWHPDEDPGCSMGFDKMYRHYVADSNFRAADVGDAHSILVEASAAYRVERRVLSRDPRSVLCDAPDCLSCRVLRGYNKRESPGAAARWLAARARRRIGGLTS